MRSPTKIQPLERFNYFTGKDRLVPILLVAGFCICMSSCGSWDKENPSVANNKQASTSGSHDSHDHAGHDHSGEHGHDHSHTEPPKSFDEQVAQGMLFLESGKIPEAWELSKSLILQRPKDANAVFLSAKVLAAKGELTNAVKMLDQFDSDDKNAKLASIGQSAEWKVELGELLEAEKNLKIIVKESPSAIPALRLLTRIYNVEGRRFEASHLMDRLIRLGDFSVKELSSTVDLREPFDEQSLRNAFLALHPNHLFARLGVIRTELYTNRYREVVDELQSLSVANPTSIEPWIWTSVCLYELGRLDELPAWYSNAPAGSEKHPEFWYVQGLLHAQDGQHEAAAHCFVETIQRDRRHVGAYHGLSDALYALGDIERAAKIRDGADTLTTISDWIQRILQNHADDNAYDRVSKLYLSLGDQVGAFAWRSAGIISNKQPMPEELLELQQKLRKGYSTPPTVLAGLDVERWKSEPIAGRVGTHPRTQEINSASQEIRLVDVASDRKIQSAYHSGKEPDRGLYTHEGIGGGVSVIDFDRDGWPDLYFTEAGDMPTRVKPVYLPKQLYRSIQAKEFAEVASLAKVDDVGYGQGTAAVDLDQDGFSDLLVANLGVINVYRNQGDGTFERISLPSTGGESRWNSSISAADLDGDSLPDIVQGSYVDGEEVFTKWCGEDMTKGSCNPKMFPPGRNQVRFSAGDWTWRNADSELLESIRKGYTLGTLITNLDGKFGNDVFFANDVSPNHLLLSRPSDVKGSFTLLESAGKAGVAVDQNGRAQACMGIACGDQNRDGLLDLIVTNFYNEVSTLYLQSTPGFFVDGTRRSRLGEATLEFLSFGCQLVDLDNDGWLDFVALNGHIDDMRSRKIPFQMRQQVLHNEQGVFRWLKSPSPGPYFDEECVGRGLVTLDYNRDGKLDLVATHLDRGSALLENQYSGSQHYVQFNLTGTRSERDATGAVIRIVAGDDKWIAASSIGDGFYGTNEKLIQIGVGSHKSIDRIVIEWPTGDQEEFSNLASDARYHVVQGIGIW